MRNGCIEPMAADLTIKASKHSNPSDSPADSQTARDAKRAHQWGYNRKKKKLMHIRHKKECVFDASTTIQEGHAHRTWCWRRAGRRRARCRNAPGEA